MSLADDKICASARLNQQYQAKLDGGYTVLTGIVLEFDLEILETIQLQYDVKKTDTTKDASGYCLVDKSGALHTGISKSDFETVLTAYRADGYNTWMEWQTLLSQVDGCTTLAQLDALQFS